MILSVLNNKWLMRVFVVFSGFLGFIYVSSMHTYMPIWKCVAKGMGTTIEGHLGLWLATHQIRSRIRFLVILFILIPLVGLYVLWHEFHSAVAVCSLIYTGWILFQTAKGKWV